MAVDDAVNAVLNSARLDGLIIHYAVVLVLPDGKVSRTCSVAVARDAREGAAVLGAIELLAAGARGAFFDRFPPITTPTE